MPCLNGEHLRAADLFRPDFIAKRKSLHFSSHLNTSAREQLHHNSFTQHGWMHRKGAEGLVWQGKQGQFSEICQQLTQPLFQNQAGHRTSKEIKGNSYRNYNWHVVPAVPGTKITSLSIPNLIHLQSSFSTFPSVFSQASFPEWEVLPHKVCWNCVSFCISLSAFSPSPRHPQSSQQQPGRC